MNNIERMIYTNKHTKYMGQQAWTVPNGLCTTNFDFACRCWEAFLNGSNTWYTDAMFYRNTRANSKSTKSAERILRNMDYPYDDDEDW